MELIYVYVDKYKAITERGLKLSTFFNVEKVGNNYEIKRNDIDKDFYCKGVDIISLFGINGSGKSTTLEFLAKLISNNYNSEQHFDMDEFYYSNIIAIYEDYGRLYYYSSGLDVNVECDFCQPVELSMFDLYMERRNIVKYSHVIEPLEVKDKIRNNKYFKYIDCSNSGLIGRVTRRDQKNKDISATFELLNKYDVLSIGIGLSPMVATIDVTRDIKAFSRKMSKKLSNYIENMSKGNSEYDESKLDYLQKILSDLFVKYNPGSEHIDTTLSYYSNIKGLDDILSVYDISKQVLSSPEKFLYFNYGREILSYIIRFSLFCDILSDVIDRKENPNVINDVLCQFFEFILFNSELKLNDIINKCVNSNWNVEDDCLIEYMSIVDSDSYEIWQLSEFIDRNRESSDSGEITFNVSEYDELLGINEVLDGFKWLFSGVDIRWNGISSGAYSLLNMFSRLNEFIKIDNVNYVFIDEGEVYLHPEWQRNYINLLTRFYETILPKDARVKVIITSHSPMVLSDLPRESTNFFGVDKADDKSFFGANLYELYSDGFTVEKTMGEFAFNKIKQLTSDIKLGGSKSELQSRVDILGDDFIKQVLMESLEKND
ncbi:AAA family ATPase [Vibrio cyclitrophicus]|uniref:AAA family ATPase n=1 Tax=Vibrio cyclitrophicus TaxID=47951 RepID=UPI000304CB90|nr:AAA family ATPase [Vibrio cyclitrophicus]